MSEMSEVTPEMGATTIESAAAKIGAMLEPIGDPEPKKRSAQDEPLEGEESLNVQEELDETEETEETELKASEVKDESDEVEQDAAQPSEEKPSKWSITELAEATGMSVEEFMSNVELTTKVDGLEGVVSLEEAQRGYQREAHTTQSQMALADERKAFEAECETAKAKMQAKLQQVDQVLNGQEQQLLDAYNAVPWAQMQAQDNENGTAETANLKSQYQEAFAQIQGQKQLATEETGKLAKEYQDKAATQNEEWRVRENAAFIAAVPGWSDPKVAEAEGGKLMKYLSKSFQQNEMNYFVDHRARDMARKAMLWDQLQDGKPALNKRVKTVPKLVKPGSPPTKADMKSGAKAKQRARLRKSGRTEDAASLITDLL